MIELEKMYTSTAKNPRNLGAHRMIEILSILYSAHMVIRDQDKLSFMLIIILIGISSINYMILNEWKKV